MDQPKDPAEEQDAPEHLESIKNNPEKDVTSDSSEVVLTIEEIINLLKQESLPIEAYGFVGKSITALSQERFVKFLKALKEFGERRNGFPQQLYDAVIARATAGIQTLHQQWPEEPGEKRNTWIKRRDIFCALVNDAVTVPGGLKEPKPGHERAIDKAVRACVRQGTQSPLWAGEQLASLIYQHGEDIEPDLLINTVVDLNASPNMPRGSSFQVCQALAAVMQQDDRFDEAMTRSLDFDHPKHFNRTARWLEFLRVLYNLDDTSPLYHLQVEGVPAPLFHRLTEAVQEKRGSYLLIKQAEALLQEWDKGDPLFYNERPYVIAPGRYGLQRPDGRFGIVHSRSNEGVREWLARQKDTEDRVNELARVNAKQTESLYDSLEECQEAERGILYQTTFRGESVKLLQEFYRTIVPEFRNLSLEDISLRKSVNPAEQRMSDAQDLLDFEFLQTGRMRDFIRADFRIELSALSLPTQFCFLQFLKRVTSAEAESLKGFVRTFGNEGIRTFLAMEFGREYGDKILAIGAALPEAEAKKLFAKFSELVDLAEEHTEDIAEEIRQSFPDVAMNGAAVFESLIARARDLLRVIPTENPATAASAASRAIAAMQNETREQSVLKSQFNAVVELLNAKNVDLRMYEAAQLLLLDATKDPRLHAVFLHTLQAFGRLKPIPEIHWRVDRSTEEQHRRLGVNLAMLMKDLVTSEEPKTILEIGPGSGVAKGQRAQSLGKGLRDYGLSDAIYFPLQPLIEKVLNFDHLERALSLTLSEAERSQIAEFVAKGVMIKGSTAVDHIEYDTDVLTRLAEDVNQLKWLLPYATEALSTSTVVPDTISSRDTIGRVIYPNKVRVREQTQNVQQAIALLADLGEDAISPDARRRDLYELMDVYPANVMIGDMRGIDRLADEQIDVEIGVRSTVYLKGKDWVDFLATLLTKLTSNGIAIDDSVRDSDGWYYRIGELVRLKNQLKNSGASAEILVITGPGFPGEDVRQDDVPLAMILSKDLSVLDRIRPYLLPGHTIHGLDELAENEAYLKTLDRTGLTVSLARKARESSSRDS